MTPRTMLLGVLVASAAFAIAAADTNSKRCLLSYKTTFLSLRDELGENKVEVIDLNEIENVVVAQFKFFYKPQVRNVRQDKKRMLIIVYMRCMETEIPLLKELVKYLNKISYQPILKFVIDARKKMNESFSMEAYVQEPSRKVFTTMKIQLSEASSNSEGTILSDKVSIFIQTERFNISTKKKGNDYTEKNGIEVVLKLKRVMPEDFKKIIDLVIQAKEECRPEERRIGPFCIWSDLKSTKYQKNSTVCSDRDPSYSEVGHELFEENMQTTLNEQCTKNTSGSDKFDIKYFYACDEIEYNREKMELMDKRTNSPLDRGQIHLKVLSTGNDGCGYITCEKLEDRNALSIHVGEGDAAHLCVRRLRYLFAPEQSYRSYAV